jgi:hypothetical protein
MVLRSGRAGQYRRKVRPNKTIGQLAGRRLSRCQEKSNADKRAQISHVRARSRSLKLSSHALLQPNEGDLMMRLHSGQNQKTGQETEPELGAYECRECFQSSWFLKVRSISFA